MPNSNQDKNLDNVISPSASIHKTAILSNKNIVIEDGVVIGPYCVLEGSIVLKKNVILSSHVIISGNTEIGENTSISAFCSIGSRPQDLKYLDEKTFLVIGKNNKIREQVTISCGTKHGGGYTRIGDDNLIMINSHIGHDCQIANHVIISNNVGLAGHITIDDYAVIGGNSGLHQFVRIGKYSMIGGMSGVGLDVPPFAMYNGNRVDILRGLNIIGLKRHGFTASNITAIKKAYLAIFNGSTSENFIMENTRSLKEVNKDKNVAQLIDFILAKSVRGIFKFSAENV